MSIFNPSPEPAVAPIDVVRLERSIARCGVGLPPRPATRTRGLGSNTADQDDATLVGDARAGDHRAFGILFSRHRGAVCAAVACRVRDRHRVEDVVQDTFLRAFLRLELLRDAANFRSWVLQIARNASVDELRRQLRARPTDVLDDDAVPAVRDDPAELVEVRQLVARMDSAMTRLATRDRRALVLAARYGCGPAELAVALGVSPGAAKVVLHRARRRLLAEIA